MRRTNARLRPVVVAVLLWCGIGALIAGVLAFFMQPSNALVISGLVLVALGIGWTIGPFETPMAWSEGALMSYEGNAHNDDADGKSAARQVVAVPAYAFLAGLLLLIAGFLA